MALKGTVREFEHDKKKRKSGVLQALTKKGTVILELDARKGVRTEFINFFITKGIKPMSNAPTWLVKGIERGVIHQEV